MILASCQRRMEECLPLLRSILFAIAMLSLFMFAVACQNGNSIDDPQPLALGSQTAVEIEETVTILVDSASLSDDSDETPRVLELGPAGRKDVMVVTNLCLPFDPGIDSAANGRRLYRLPLVREIHAGLTRVSSGAAPVVELDLAEFFTVLENGVEYQFKLRKDLKFSDDSPITAADVKWSWERALRLSTSWSRARVVLGNIEGSADVIADGERIREEEAWLRLQHPMLPALVSPQAFLEGVNIIDALTLEVSLTNPVPDFPVLLAEPPAFVLKKSNVESWTVSWTNDVFPGVVLTDVTRVNPGKSLAPNELPVGAGPFRLIAYTPDAYFETCAIARNENYWDTPPQLEGVIFVPPDGAMVSAYLEDDIDYVLPPLEYDGVGLTSSTLISKTQRPPTSRFLALNPNHPPFDDLQTRRALLSSNDLAEVYAITEVKWPDTIVPYRLVPAYQHCDRAPYVFDNPLEIIQSSEYNAHLGDFEVEFWTRGEDYQTERVNILLDQWERAFGLLGRVRDLEFGNNVETLMRDGGLQIRLVEIAPETPSLVPFFQDLIGVFGGKMPHEEWSTVEKMILEALQDADEASQFRKFREVECHLYDRALVLPMIVDSMDFEINIQPWVNNFALPTFGYSVFKDVWFDESAPVRELPWP